MSFEIRGVNDTAVVVHSWPSGSAWPLKRSPSSNPGEGLYTDMNAIRRTRIWTTSTPPMWTSGTGEDHHRGGPEHRVPEGDCPLHCGGPADTQAFLRSVFPQLSVLPEIPEEVTFVTTQELEDRYPRLHPQGAGERLCEGAPGDLPHGHRRQAEVRQAPRRPGPPDYDDWNLNGDLLCWGQRQRPGHRAVLHGHPGEPRIPGQAAHPGRLRRAPGAALPQNAPERPAPPDHGRRHRPVPAVHAAPWARPISARSRCPYGTRARWRPVTHRASSYCKSRSGPCPDKRFCRRQKPWRRANSFRPEHLNLSGTPSGPGRMGTRPISARSRCPYGTRARWRPVTHRASSYCKSRSGPCPDKRFCRRQKPWRRANSFRPSI